MSRGPDRYKRKRRTKAEIEAARRGYSTYVPQPTTSIQEHLAAIDKQVITPKAPPISFEQAMEQLKEEKAFKEKAFEETTKHANGNGNGHTTHTLQGTAIDYVVMDEQIPEEPTKPQENLINIEALVARVKREVEGDLAADLHKALEEKSNAILAEARKLSASSKIAIAVKINEQPTRKLSREAHPELAEVLSYVQLSLENRKAGNDEELIPFLVGPAGCGKTLLAAQVAESLQLPFGYICLTAGASEAWLYGRHTPTGFQEGLFSKMFREGGVFLADEMDAADQNLLISINTPLGNKVLHNPYSGETFPMHPNFIFIAAGNTFGKGGDAVYTGRTRLDGATLDRFQAIVIDYDPKTEERILPDGILLDKIRKLRKGLKDRGATEILSYRGLQRAHLLKKLGKSDEEILKKLTVSWPMGLLAELQGRYL